jgi:hypothetical protein
VLTSSLCTLERLRDLSRSFSRVSIGLEEVARSGTFRAEVSLHRLTAVSDAWQQYMDQEAQDRLRYDVECEGLGIDPAAGKEASRSKGGRGRGRGGMDGGGPGRGGKVGIEARLIGCA